MFAGYIAFLEQRFISKIGSEIPEIIKVDSSNEVVEKKG